MRGDPQVVWFKRDLRVSDHAPLVSAAQRGPVLPLFIIEPDIQAAPDFDALHYQFIRRSLVELRENLRALGQPLIVRTGSAVTVLANLHRVVRFDAMWSHEETGNHLTYQRDLAVKQWTEIHRIRWNELPQNGVVRRLKTRNGWAKHWEDRIMGTPPLANPARLVNTPHIESGNIPTAEELRLRSAAPRHWDHVQCGGEAEAQRYLSSFLAGRGKDYRRGMSSPSSGATACSRISPYLAWGCLSIKQAAHAASAALQVSGGQIPRNAIQSFTGRLHWHCHFIQKLESEPGIEFHCFNRACESLRAEPPEDHDRRLDAWITGHTGYPFLDACMRSLRATGWLNFRMRAMLVSFAAYNLWLDWRVFNAPLACHFLDYEPGIHFSQIQMQSGTTGINTLRIYNPIKQGLDHDPDGHFIRQWLPEIAGIPTPLIHTPWKSGANHLHAYPAPIVNHLITARTAKANFNTLRKSPSHNEEAKHVFAKHGSRKHRNPALEATHRAGGNDLPLRSGRKQNREPTQFQIEIQFE